MAAAAAELLLLLLLLLMMLMVVVVGYIRCMLLLAWVDGLVGNRRQRDLHMV